MNESDEREKREWGAREGNKGEGEEMCADREKERGREEVERGGKGLRVRRRERGSRGVVRGQGNEISICWREEEINTEGEKTGTLKGHKSEREIRVKVGRLKEQQSEKRERK